MRRRKNKLESYNLIDEPWIQVLKNDGNVTEVSLSDFFNNAHNYLRFAGETPVQDFAVLRFLLSVMHTVFSRVDSEGNIYEGIILDEKMKQEEPVDEWENDSYPEKLMKTWDTLWKMDTLPEIITEYLYKWKDRFDFFDKENPFYQISEEQFKKLGGKGGEIQFKYINRLISESNNKQELFSPYSEKDKNNLTIPEAIRWLISFQGYTGTGDKKKHPSLKSSAGKGWLLGLSGIYLSGNNLKDTLLLNMVMNQNTTIQKPIWEKDFSEKESSLLDAHPDNLSELYTSWSRLLYMNHSEENLISVEAFQLPGINPREFFLEPMTMWRYAKSGNDKDHTVPKQYTPEKSFWRSFGNLMGQTDKKTLNRRPGIIDWYNCLIERGTVIDGRISIMASAMNYNRDASTMPNDEITDEINIYSHILSDIGEKGWIPRITGEIERTQETIFGSIVRFGKDIETIRNQPGGNLSLNLEQEVYFLIDSPFRDWLSGLKPEDSKEEKIIEWRRILEKILISKADFLIKNSGNREYKGIETQLKEGGKSGVKNIFTAYNNFKWNINKILWDGGGSQ